jgi:hypothetical protein
VQLVNQIVIDYEVYDQRHNDADLLVPAIELHQAMLGRTPHLVAADAAFYSNKYVAFLDMWRRIALMRPPSEFDHSYATY